jgi:hypothetical protein
VLVSHFMIPVDFCAKANRLSLLGSRSPLSGYLGTHAMLIIGVRDEGGSRRFLLQYWWADFQFIEADEEYLFSMAGRAYQVITPQTNQSAATGAFWRPAKVYTEAGDVDMEDRGRFYYHVRYGPETGEISPCHGMPEEARRNMCGF